MKKFALIILLVALTCIFCACPSQGNPEVPDNNVPEQEKTPDQGETPEQGDTPEQEVTKMYITIYGNKLEVTLAQNSSVKELVELLKQGNITYTASDYGGFEKVGYIGHSLTTNNSQITTEPGDVVLYQGNQICIMVGSNSWSYTRIGKINGYSTSELKKLIGTGKGSAEVTLSLS